MITRVGVCFLLVYALLVPAFSQTVGQFRESVGTDAVSGPGVIENFEAFAIAPGDAVNLDCPVLNSTAVCNGQGPGLVVPGIDFVFFGGVGSWDGTGYYGSTSKQILSNLRPLTIDFTTVITVFSVNIRAFTGYSAIASMTVYGPDDTTVIGTQSDIALSTRGVPRRVGWQDSGGIGKVELTQANQAWSPIIDNLEFANPIAVFTIDPNHAFPGVPIGLSGSGFAANETVNILTQNATDSNVLGTLTADASGAFNSTARVPPVPNGTQLVYAVGETSELFGAALLTVEPGLVLTPNAGPAGSTASVQGFGYIRGETVKLVWDNPRVSLGTTVADAHGRFAPFTITVPDGAAAGDNIVLGQGQDTAAVGAGHFTVE